MDSGIRFTHLHLHTQYSLLDGIIRIPELITEVKRKGMKSVAITDHGNMFGVIYFYKEALKKGVKPIIGMETYIAPGDRKEKKLYSGIPDSSFHLTLLAKTVKGYKNLLKLSSSAYLEGFYYKPRIDKEILSQHSEGLVALSGCMKGEVAFYLRRGEKEKALKSAAQYKEILGENYYIELQNLKMKGTEELIKELVEIARKLDIKIVATNDVHFLKKEDYRIQDVVLCIQTQKKLADPDRMKMESHEMYLKSPEEMYELFHELPEALENAWKIGEECNVHLDVDTGNILYPNYPRPDSFRNDAEYLRYLIEKGAKKRYPELNDRIKSRIEKELKVIENTGFAGYFLIVKNLIDYAKKEGIPVGPGRGSAVGSVILYILGITEIDPIEHNLLFERFLNPERISPPDIDIDFGDIYRDNIIDYLKNQYGKDNVAQIITFDTMKARQSIRDVGRVMGIPLSDVDKIAKLIGDHSTLKEAIEEVSELRTIIKSSKEFQELYFMSEKVEGLTRHASAHASGVVITPKALTEFSPLYSSDREQAFTQYDMKSLDSIGLLKLDILALRTLTVIQKTVSYVKEYQNRDLTIEELPLNDKKTYHLLSSGYTTGVFQFESRGMRDLLTKAHPTEFKDLIALVALYRPGAMGYIDVYIKRKEGKEKIEYFHPLLEPVLKETYGVPLYQEQVMQIARVFAGFSLGKADILRKAMGKKIQYLMEEMEEEFIKGAKEKNVKEREAKEIYSKLKKFSQYGFNKSHAAGYALLAYRTAYLKAHYPLEFTTAALSTVIERANDIKKFINDAKQLGIPIYPPSINKSDYDFKIEEEGIRFGLGGIKNVGKQAIYIIREREQKGPYKSLEECLARNRNNINKKVFETLIKAGAFDEFNKNRGELLAQLSYKLKSKANLFQGSLFGKTGIVEQEKEEEEEEDIYRMEREAFGFYFSAHPLDKYRIILKDFDIKTITEIKEGKNGWVAGVFESVRKKRDINGNLYAQAIFQDFEDSIPLFIFSKVYEETKEFIKEDELVVIKGNLIDEENPKLKVNKVLKIEGILNRIKGVILEVDKNLNESAIIEIKKVIEEYRGKYPLYFSLINGMNGYKLLKVKNTGIEIFSDFPRKVQNIEGVLGIRIKSSSSL